MHADISMKGTGANNKEIYFDLRAFELTLKKLANYKNSLSAQESGVGPSIKLHHSSRSRGTIHRYYPKSFVGRNDSPSKKIQLLLVALLDSYRKRNHSSLWMQLKVVGVSPPELFLAPLKDGIISTDKVAQIRDLDIPNRRNRLQP